MQTPELTASEELEARFIQHVVLHTRSLDEATEYLKSMDMGTLRKRRKKYGTQDPPLGQEYNGPKLSQQEMVESFFAQGATRDASPLDLARLMQMLQLTITPPNGQALTVPLSSVLPGAARG